MSGGSYEYLYLADHNDILDKLGQLKDMADRLDDLEYAVDAARDTRELLLLVERYRYDVDAACGNLKGVWKAVEWWDSNDSSEEEVRNAITAYQEKRQGT